MSTNIRDGPKYVIASKPSETCWEDKSLAEVKLASTKFNQVPECHDEKHERQSKALYNICVNILKLGHGLRMARSCGPAQVIWNRLSFSNFLNTLPLISTNWLETRRVSKA